MPPPPGGEPTGYPPPPRYQAAPAYRQESGRPGGPRTDAPVVTRRPASINTAKHAMNAGAVMQLLAIPAMVMVPDQMREIAEQTYLPGGALSIEVDMAMNFGFRLVSSMFGAALWFLMAYLNARRQGWARIVATVLYGAFSLFFISELGAPEPMNPTIVVTLHAFGMISGAVALFFLWRKDSTAWFEARKAA